MTAFEKYKKFVDDMRQGLTELIQTAKSAEEETESDVVKPRFQDKMNKIMLGLEELHRMAWAFDNTNTNTDLTFDVRDAIDFVLKDDGEPLDQAVLANVLLYCHKPYLYDFNVSDLMYLSSVPNALAWSVLKHFVNGYSPAIVIVNQSIFDQVVDRYDDKVRKK